VGLCHALVDIENFTVQMVIEVVSLFKRLTIAFFFTADCLYYYQPFFN